MRAWIFVVSLVGGSTIAATPARAGELDNVRRETQGSGSSGSSGSSESGGSSGVGSAIGGAIGAAIGAAMIDAYSENVWRLYTRYPYEPGTNGYVHVIPEETPEDQRPGQKFAGSFALDGAYLGPTLGRTGLDLHLMVRRFGFALDASPHIEAAPRDALTLGSVAFMIAPVLRPRVQLYAGAGANVMIDGRASPAAERTNAAGFNATFQTTLLPIRPLIVRGRIDAGTLGAATTVLGRVTLGAALRRFELFVGYEARAVGEVVLHGPTAGLRVWF